MKSRRFGFLHALLAAVLFVVAWELAVRIFALPRYLLPAPSLIWETAIRNLDALMRHMWATLWATLAGFGLSVVIGIPLAIGIVYSRVLESILYPPLVASQAVPKMAIAPLMVVWFGFGFTSKVIIAFLMAFFPIVIDTVTGLRSIDTQMLNLARSMDMSGANIFVKIRFPYAMPYVFSGLKVAMTLSVVGAVVGEFVASSRGLGYYLLQAQGAFDTPLVFAALVLLTIMGVILFQIMVWLERLLVPWSPSIKL